jgi:hypothetical protein
LVDGQTVALIASREGKNACVCQPIIREGLDQWRQFELQLGSLRDAFGDAPPRYR